MADSSSNTPPPKLRRRPATNDSIRSHASERRRFFTWSTRSGSDFPVGDDAAANSASQGAIETYPIYDLEWQQLLEYLLSIWPNETFTRRVVRVLLTVLSEPYRAQPGTGRQLTDQQEADRYIFETPTPLTTVSQLSFFFSLFGRISFNSSSFATNSTDAEGRSI
jgi:hypothetical protein